MNRMGRLRAAVSRIDQKELRATIGALNRQDLGGLHPTERAALRSLRSSRNPTQSILQPHYGPALQPVAEVLTHECLEATRDALGEAADAPTLEQLQEALVAVRSRFALPMVALMLATTAASDAPAADICDEILNSSPDLGLTQLPAQEPPTVGEPRPASARTPKAKPQKPAPQESHKPWKNSRGSGPSPSPASPPAAAGPAGSALGRRSAHLPPEHEGRFDPDDPLSGAVVIASIDFDAPDQPTGSKPRPCVVVAGSSTALLVRAGYSGRYQAESWRSTPLVHWRRAGLDKPTHIEAGFRQVEREGVEVVGRLVEEDWNALW